MIIPLICFIVHFKDLIAKTTSDHPDYDDLHKAITEIDKIAADVNKQIEKQDSVLMLLKVQKCFVTPVKVYRALRMHTFIVGRRGLIHTMFSSCNTIGLG